MNNSANDVVLGRHLDNAEKRIKREIDKIAAGGASVAVFTGATTAVGGTSGLVPAPLAGDNGKFLRGDGTWAAFSGSVDDSVISADVSAVEGGFWQDIINNVPVLKLRHGDYEYIFQYDSFTKVSDESTTIETVTPNLYVLGTASSTVDGGIWYEVNSQDVPTLKLHKGSFDYSFNYDSSTYKGGNRHLVAYLPFDTSMTADACGNEWVTGGNPRIYNGRLYLHDYACYVTNSTISDSIGAQPWAFDFWATAEVNGCFFGTFNTLYPSGTNQWVGMKKTGESVAMQFYGNDPTGSIPVSHNSNHHYAMTYDGTVVRMFVDGVLSLAKEHQITLGGNFVIGTQPDHGEYLVGSIDHFRIFKGTALWTENFTPPTAEDYL